MEKSRPHVRQLLIFSGWLDDIGLPQYKDHFHDAMVDGRMLNNLSVVSRKQVTRDVMSTSDVNMLCGVGGPAAPEGDEPDASSEHQVWNPSVATS